MIVQRLLFRGQSRFHIGQWLTALCLRAVLFAIFVVALTRLMVTPAIADDIYQPGHVYVNYTTEWVPCAQGNLVDVTGQLSDDDQGHVHDIHGNVLTIDTSTNSVLDVNGHVSGFVYSAAPS